MSVSIPADLLSFLANYRRAKIKAETIGEKKGRKEE
jgi:hypothetical protein